MTNLTKDPVTKTLLRISIPMMFSFLASILFNLIDTYFVGLIDTQHLAAMSFTFPVVFIAGGIAMGVGVGVSATVSKAVGENNFLQANKLAITSLMLALFFALIFTVLGILFIDPVFRLMGASDQILPYIKKYMYPWYLGLIFFMLSTILDQIIRATGDTKTSALMTLAGVLVNLVLDPILIFGLFGLPMMGLLGAALATIFSRVMMSVMMLLFSTGKRKIIRWQVIGIKEIFDCWQQILRIGLVVSLTNILRTFGLVLVTKITADFGNAAVAAFGIGIRIESLMMVVVISFGEAIRIFVGQNLGAKNFSRIKQGVEINLILTMGWSSLIAVILFVLAKPIATLINQDLQVIEVLTLYLKLVPCGLGFFGIMMTSNQFLNVIGQQKKASVIMLSRVFLLYVPLAYLGAKFYQLPGVFLAAPLSSFLIACIAIKVIAVQLKKLPLKYSSLS